MSDRPRRGVTLARGPWPPWRRPPHPYRPRPGRDAPGAPQAPARLTAALFPNILALVSVVLGETRLLHHNPGRNPCRAADLGGRALLRSTHPTHDRLLISGCRKRGQQAEFARPSPVWRWESPTRTQTPACRLPATTSLALYCIHAQLLDIYSTISYKRSGSPYPG